jgi:uncharacterized protein (DUF885 family)
MITRICQSLGGILLLLMTAGVCAASFTAQERETSRLHAWLDEQYEQELTRTPEQLTYLGRKERYDQMNDYSEAGWAAEVIAMKKSATAMADEFDYEKLSFEGQVSYDFWRYRGSVAQQEQEFQRQAYVFDQFSGAHTYFAEFLINYHDVSTPADMQDYIARVSASGRALRQLLQRAKLAAEDGIRPPTFAYDHVVRECLALISGAPFEQGEKSPILDDAEDKISSLLASGAINQAGALKLSRNLETVLLQDWLPAYQSIIDWMKFDKVNTSKHSRGVGALPRGTEYYNYQLKLNAQMDLSAEEIHQIGLRAVARIRQDMEKIKVSVGFEGSLAEFFDFVRTDGQFYFPNTDAGRRAYQDETRGFFKRMEALLPQYFGVLPKALLRVKRVEPYMEQDGASAYYAGGSPDGSRSGIYYLHLSDMTAQNKTDLETTAYHEGYPGHHLQGSIAMERDDLPLFRSIEWYSAYTEGWALYAEQLAKEMGAFESPYYDFGRLANEIWRAVRLVVDTGIHAKGWTEQQTIDYVLANTASPLTTVRSEVERYFVAPGQALSYKMGMIKILQLRSNSKKKLGERFDIRSFHDVVLGGGSLPLPLLERAVQDWLTRQDS